MEYFIGIDVSLEASAVCVMDQGGAVVKEAKVLSEPDALIAFVRLLSHDVSCIGMEAGPLSQWLYKHLNAEFRPRIKAQTVLASAETVPMRLGAMMAAGQIQLSLPQAATAGRRMPKVDGRGAWHSPSPRSALTSRPDQAQIHMLGERRLRFPTSLETEIFQISRYRLAKLGNSDARPGWIRSATTRTGPKFWHHHDCILAEIVYKSHVI